MLSFFLCCIVLDRILDFFKFKFMEDLFVEVLDMVIIMLYGVIGGVFNWEFVEF